MSNFGQFIEKEKYVAAILRALRDQGWFCPEYESARKAITMQYIGIHVPEYCGTIAQKGEWSFVLWNHSPYTDDFALPRGRKWGLFFRDRLVDSGRKLKPPESVIRRVVAKAGMSTEGLVALILASS